MPNIYFYAARDDDHALVDFAFRQPGWVMGEVWSRPDRPARTFSTAAEVHDATDLDLGQASQMLYIHTPAMGGRPVEKQITFKPGAMPGATGRTTIEGAGLILINFGGMHQGRLVCTTIGHLSEGRAREWAGVYPLAAADSWDWAEVARVQRLLSNWVRRTAVAKFGRRPVLPAAEAAQATGLRLAGW